MWAFYENILSKIMFNILIKSTYSNYQDTLTFSEISRKDNIFDFIIGKFENIIYVTSTLRNLFNNKFLKEVLYNIFVFI